MSLALTTLLKSVMLTALACVLALVVNLTRGTGLPLVAERPYEIYVPCPLMLGEATAVEPSSLPADLSGLVVVDARPTAELERIRLPGARAIPYRPLRAPDEAVLSELKALGPNRILVYGDAEIDSGRLLASELSAAGCLGVRYIAGGLDAWVRSGRKVVEGR